MGTSVPIAARTVGFAISSTRVAGASSHHPSAVWPAEFDQGSIDELSEQASDLIQTFVLTLRSWVKAQRGASSAANLPAARRRVATNLALAGRDASSKKLCEQETVH